MTYLVVYLLRYITINSIKTKQQQQKYLTIRIGARNFYRLATETESSIPIVLV